MKTKKQALKIQDVAKEKHVTCRVHEHVKHELLTAFLCFTAMMTSLNISFDPPP